MGGDLVLIALTGAAIVITIIIGILAIISPWGGR